MAPAVDCIIIARNEEKFLPRTLQSLVSQELNRIILVNDNSTDNTKNIALDYGIEVADFPYDHPNWVISENLGRVFNYGFAQLDPLSSDYVLVMGADHILPKDYVQTITQNMKKDNAVVASGFIKGDNASSVRGSGRIIDSSYLRRLGWCYPSSYGYESYMLYKALQLGLNTKVYPIETATQRKTGTNYSHRKYYHRGKALRALGYHPIFTLGYAAKYELKKPGAGLLIVLGYIVNTGFRYEHELQQSVRHQQVHRMNSILTRYKLGKLYISRSRSSKQRRHERIKMQ